MNDPSFIGSTDDDILSIGVENTLNQIDPTRIERVVLRRRWLLLRQNRRSDECAADQQRGLERSLHDLPQDQWQQVPVCQTAVQPS